MALPLTSRTYQTQIRDNRHSNDINVQEVKGMRPLLDPVSRQGILKALPPGAWHCLQKEVLFETPDLRLFQIHPMAFWSAIRPDP